jgi:putative addiction module killer protein
MLGQMRVYYALADTMLVLLLCGGDKGSQNTDINAPLTIGRTGSEGQNER